MKFSRSTPAAMVRFICPTHGRIVDTFKSAAVVCHCGKDAKPEGGK
jgi:hypothetical protein